MTAATRPPPGAAPAEYLTLADLQARHTELVAVVGPAGPVKGHHAAVTEFVDLAVRTGRALDAREDRQAAQSLVNFWVSRAAAESRSASAPILAADHNTLLDRFDPATMTGAVAKAERELRRVAADRVLVRRILLRLVHLRPDDDGLAAGPPPFDPAPVPRCSLQGIPGSDKRTNRFAPEELPNKAVDDRDGAVDRVIGVLAAAGVVRVAPGPAGSREQISLRAAVLTAGWERLNEALGLRRQFRHLAVEARKEPPGLHRIPSGFGRLVGDGVASLGRRLWRGLAALRKRVGTATPLEFRPHEQQVDAEEYGDLNEAEVVYLRDSRTRQRRLDNINRGLLALMTGLLVVAVALAVAAWTGWSAAEVARGKEATERKDAEKAREEAKVEQGKAVAAREDADTQRKFAERAWESAVEEAKAARDAEDEAVEKEKDRAAREQLSGLRLLVRAQAKVYAAYQDDRPVDALEIALRDWGRVARHLPDRDLFPPDVLQKLSDKTISAHDAIIRFGGRPEPSELLLLTPSSLHNARNKVARRPDTRKVLEGMRDDSFTAVRLASSKINDVYQDPARRPVYARVAPYADEFWFQYWGEMLLVEGPGVEKAMIAFGAVLDDLKAYRDDAADWAIPPPREVNPTGPPPPPPPPVPSRLDLLRRRVAVATKDLHDALNYEKARPLPGLPPHAPPAKD